MTINGTKKVQLHKIRVCITVTSIKNNSFQLIHWFCKQNVQLENWVSINVRKHQ